MKYPIEKYKFREFERKNSDGTKSKVVMATSRHRGALVNGFASCQEGDTYDYEFGKKLAAAKCNMKVCKKRHKASVERLKELLAVAQELADELEKVTEIENKARQEFIESVNGVNSLLDEAE